MAPATGVADGAWRPHPETKRRHHQNASTLEIITAHVPRIGYGDRVELYLDAKEIAVFA